MKKLIALLNLKNSFEYNIRKTIEELNELSLELIHKINKKTLDNTSEIIKEIVDVEIRLKWLKHHLDCKEKFKERKKIKIKYLLKNVINK